MYWAGVPCVGVLRLTQGASVVYSTGIFRLFFNFPRQRDVSFS